MINPNQESRRGGFVIMNRVAIYFENDRSLRILVPSAPVGYRDRRNALQREVGVRICTRDVGFEDVTG